MPCSRVFCTNPNKYEVVGTWAPKPLSGTQYIGPARLYYELELSPFSSQELPPLYPFPPLASLARAALAT